jgi:ubiquinone/menaquinone biosynthesis C-methylase UbiE
MRRTLEPEVMDTPEEADGYDAMDHSEPNAAFVARLVQLGARGRMLDVGTGPGHIPLLACERIADCYVVAVDLARHMLAHAERHRAASPHGGRVELRLADAKGLDFEDGSFDAVFSNTILHHIPEPEHFLREAWRVLRPGGVLLVRDLFRPETTARAMELVRMHAGDATPCQQELFRASLHAALTPAELFALSRSIGMCGVELAIDSDRHMSLQTSAKGVEVGSQGWASPFRTTAAVDPARGERA